VAADQPSLTAGDYVLVCDKPAGVTSHDVVASIRRSLPRKTKVGHAGTLDPFATWCWSAGPRARSGF
jgi:tRNA U55 pseudouridine synthase TruB